MNMLDLMMEYLPDRWFTVRVGKRKDVSYIRVIGVKNPQYDEPFIELFSYYPKTGKIDTVIIKKIKHMMFVQVAEDISESLENRLNTEFVKVLLQR